MGIRLLIIIFSIFAITSLSTSEYSFAQTVPDPPHTLTAVPVFGTDIQATWMTPQNDGGSTILGYYLTRMSDTETIFRERPFSSDPTSYWKFDGSSTGLVDYGNDPKSITVIGTADYVVDPDFIGGSFSLDGNTRVTLLDPGDYDFDIGKPFSISFWIKTTADNQSDYFVSKTNAGTGKGFYIWRWSSNDHVTFTINDGTKFNLPFIATAINDGQPHHIVATYDGSANRSGMTLWVDGVAVHGSSSSNFRNFNSDNPLTAGATFAGGSPTTGIIDDVRIFDGVVLDNTQTQIDDLKNISFLTNNQYQDSEIVGGISYSYKVSAVNDNGQSYPTRMEPPTLSSIQFMDTPYMVGHSGIIRVTDPSADLNPTGIDRIPIVVTSHNGAPTEPQVQFYLMETDIPGIFENENRLIFSTVVSDAEIPVIEVLSGGNTITASYQFAPDANEDVDGDPGGGTPPIGIPIDETVKKICQDDNPDNDFICNEWEDQFDGLSIQHGAATFEQDCGAGTIDPVCPKDDIQDIYVEVDWMAGHKPNQQAIDRIVDSFKETNNIQLHVIMDNKFHSTGI